MWEIIEGLPADVFGEKVLSMLGLKDIVRLDSATGCKEKKTVLFNCFRFARISRNQSLWGVQGSKKVSFLQWIIARGLRLSNLTVESQFRELIPLLMANPATVEERVHVLCNKQADLDELEDALSPLANITEFKFTLNIVTKEAVSIRNASKLRRHVTDNVTWDAEFTNPEDVSALVRENRCVHRINIYKPTFAAMEITASLGDSLQHLFLACETLTDDQLAVVGNACCKLQIIFLSTNNGGAFDTGMVALARGSKDLRDVHISGRVSDAAVAALCTHCPSLDNVDIVQGFLTKPALVGLIASGALINHLTIGWKVASATDLHRGTRFLKTLRTFVVIVGDDASAPTLAQTLSLMTNLYTLILAREDDNTTPYPAEILAMLVHSCPVVSRVKVTLQAVSGATEQLWVQMFTRRPALTSIECAGAIGVEFTDNVLQTLAQHCPNLEAFWFKAALTATDAGIAALAKQCVNLQYLHVEGGGGLTDAAVFALVEHSTGLQQLHLPDCALISEAALVHLLNSCVKLTWLAVPSACMSRQALEEVQKTLLPRRVHISCR